MTAGPAKPSASVVIEQELAAILLSKGQRGGILGDQGLFAGELGELDDVVHVAHADFSD